MGLFSRKEKRSVVECEDTFLSALIGGSSEVTKAEALQIPTVSACVNLIADRISALPIKLYRENGKEVEEITEDNRLNMLNHDTGDTINATEMKKLWIRDFFLGKGSYTYIERNMFNEPTGLFYVDEKRLAIAPGVDPIHKTYSIQVNGRIYFPFQFLKILRNSKGFGTGTSVIEENPLSLAIYYNTMKFENATIRKGGNKKGYILAKNKLTQDAMDKVKEAWRKLYSNSYDTKDNAVVLNDGLDFKESSSTSVELQLNENKRTNADEICKLFCMPADVLNGKADEHMISQFVQNCLMPLINTIESALDTDLLTEAEKAGHYYFAFDTSELTRGDFASRMNAYAVALQNNIYQLDEIREMEDKPPLGFNFIKLGLDAVLVDPKTREIYTPNTGKLEKMNAEHLTDEQLRAILEERYNPYHDPTNGRFTTADMGGWGSGAALVVEKGEKGAGKYVFNSNLSSSTKVPGNTTDSVEKATGATAGAPKSIQNAVSGANPNKYRVNCQRCVQAYELRRRGYDVEALPSPKKEFWGNECFVDSALVNAGKQHTAYQLNLTEKSVKDAITSSPDGSRFSVYCVWKGRGAKAHVFIAEKSGSNIYFVDPQTGDLDVSQYFKLAKKNNFGIFRMDDKPIIADEALIQRIVKKS